MHSHLVIFWSTSLKDMLLLTYFYVFSSFSLKDGIFFILCEWVTLLQKYFISALSSICFETCEILTNIWNMWNSKKYLKHEILKNYEKYLKHWNPKKLWKIFEAYEIKKKCENIINRKWSKESSII